MTTLELAAKVVDVVRDVSPYMGREDIARFVLACLRENESWFCRLTLTEDAEGLHRDTLEEPYELEQLELFT